MTRLYATAGVIAISALLGWSGYQIYAQRTSDVFAACRTGNIAGGPIGGPFSLVDQTGKAVTDQDVLAKPALVYFGYTSCGDVCPLDNARNVQAAALLAAKGLDVTPVFISVDPARDTPAVLAEYTSNFSDTLLGLTGTPDQIKAAANAYKAYFKVPDAPGPTYDVDHTTLTYLMLPKTGFADFFLRDASAEDIAERTGCFLNAS